MLKPSCTCRCISLWMNCVISGDNYNALGPLVMARSRACLVQGGPLWTDITYSV